MPQHWRICEFTNNPPVIGMINIRLGSIRKKMQMIARASKAQQQQSQQQTMMRRRSGDMTSRSVPSS